MLNLNCKIKIYETNKDLQPEGDVFEFSHVKDIFIESSYKNFTDTAVIKMPKAVVINQLNNALGIEIARRLPFDLKQRSIHEFFKQDHYIEIFLGYNGDYKPAFRGYIASVKGDAPVCIECEDFMYFLKKYKMVPDATPAVENDPKNPISNNPSQLLQDVNEAIVNRLAQIKVPFDTNILEEEINDLIIDRNHNIVQFFNQLKKEYGIYAYFKLEEEKSTLYVTNNPCVYSEEEISELTEQYLIQDQDVPLPKTILKRALSILGVNDIVSFFKSDSFLGEGRFRFHYNIIRDDLKIKIEEAQKIRIRAEKYFSNSNTPIHVEAGDPDGELIKKYTLHDNQKALSVDNAILFKKETQEAQAELSSFATLRLAQKKQTGLTGSFETFGEPFMRPTDRVFLEDSEDKEKNGVFQVEGVKRRYGVGGYRQSISLGRLVSKEENKAS